MENLDQRNTNISLAFVSQELDSAYMAKMESDVRVEILRQELEFLRCLHEAVSTLLRLKAYPQVLKAVLSFGGSQRFCLNRVIWCGEWLVLGL